MKRAKTSVKVAIVSALTLSSTAAVIYAAPKIIKSQVSTDTEARVYLDVEKVDSDTVKVSLDNIEDIAKSIQFSIKLDENVKIKKDDKGSYLIKDLLAEEINMRIKNNGYTSENSIITDYTYNEDSNTIDVLITAEDSLPKTENKIEIFTLDIEAKTNDNKKFNIIPENVDSYKYVSKDNKEYSNLAVEYDDNLISLNTVPSIEYTGKEINIYDGDELVFEKIAELKASDADEGDAVSLEVRNITNVEEGEEDDQPLITEFVSEERGSYIFKINAVDSMGEKSEAIKIVVNVSYNLNLDAPIISGVEDVTVQSGSIFEPLNEVSATDAKGRKLDVKVSGDLDLNPENDTTYVLIYSTIDRYGKETTKTRNVSVIANKTPVISGVENTVINIGDNFDDKRGVEVTDDLDKDLIKSLVVEGKVNTSVAGEYRLNYHVTDSGNKTARAQRVVRVNRAPIVSGNDSTLVVNSKKELTEEIILGGITITDETDYSVDVQIPTINGEGRYEATIRVTDEDNGVTEVKRNIVVSDSSVAELPDSGEGTSLEDSKVIQVINEQGIELLNEKLSEATKEYKIGTTKKNFSEYVQYTFEISKKEAVFRNSDKIYIKVKVPNEIEESTGGINITEYVEVLATSITINDKEGLNHYIKKGDEINLQATISPDNVTNGELEWISSNEEILEVVKVESGVKVIAKDYGIATVKVGAVDGSEKYDEFTFNVAHDFNELPNDVTVVGGEGTEELPIIYETENIESLNKLISNAKDDFKVLLQDKKVLSENKVEYYLKLEEKGMLSKVFGRANRYYIALRLPSDSKFEEILYKLEKDDTKAPTLIYNGEMEITLENRANFEIPIVIAKDNLDKDITVEHVIKNSDNKVIDSIDTSVAGKYTITYSASDISGNKSEELVIKVTVLEADTEAPKFDYAGEKIIVLDNGSEYEIPNITAIDNVDNDIEVSSVITKDGESVNDIDTTISGEYIITYTAVDKAGNKSTLELKIIVKELETPDELKDTEAPIFNYSGELDVVLEYGEKYDIPSITAIDNVDGPVEVSTTIKKDSSNEIITAIDTKVPGVYIITYETIDKAQNKAELVMKVTVKAKMIADNIELGKGDGSIESPSEIIVLESTTSENITKLLEGIRNQYNIEFVGEPQEEDNNVIFKIKLEEKISVLRVLFGKTGESSYIELKIPKANVEVLKIVNDLYESAIGVPENPEVPDVSEKPQKPGDYDIPPIQDNNQSDKGETKPEIEVSPEYTNNKNNILPETGGRNSLIALGIGVVVSSLGGLIYNKKKKK